jgi:hypothetical protein
MLIYNRPNIALSALSSWIPDLDKHTPYIAPHPQRGTRYHRYTTLLLPQQSPFDEISMPILSETDRCGFDVRAFMEQYGLDGNKGGGVHMFREVWDPFVSSIYKNMGMLLTYVFLHSPPKLISRTTRANIWQTQEGGSLFSSGKTIHTVDTDVLQMHK